MVAGIVILGGVQRIGQVTSYMVPFMAIFYIAAGVVVIALRIITREDLKLVPKGDKIARLFRLR